MVEHRSVAHFGVAGESLPALYRDLRGLAHCIFGEQPVGHTLQATAVVHEAYLKLARSSANCQSRAHLLALAARVMRQILADHARRRASQRRGGSQQRAAFFDPGSGGDGFDPLVLDEALQQLAELDPRQARIVELRFFSDLSNEEIATLLVVSERTVERDWQAAKAWLRRALRDLPR